MTQDVACIVDSDHFADASIMILNHSDLLHSIYLSDTVWNMNSRLLINILWRWSWLEKRKTM